MTKFGKTITAIFTTLFIIGAAIVFTACNRQIIDTTYSYNYAYIALPNGEVVEGKVQSWKDYDDGDQLQITIDGKTYLTHSSRVVLIDE